MRTCHRVVVMREQKKVAEFTGESDDKIMQAIAGSAS
jgi:ABC-type sugar transport system ATPase subunit